MIGRKKGARSTEFYLLHLSPEAVDVQKKAPSLYSIDQQLQWPFARLQITKRRRSQTMETERPTATKTMLRAYMSSKLIIVLCLVPELSC